MKRTTSNKNFQMKEIFRGNDGSKLNEMKNVNLMDWTYKYRLINCESLLREYCVGYFYSWFIGKRKKDKMMRSSINKEDNDETLTVVHGSATYVFQSQIHHQQRETVTIQ